jgi:hypothetical protein
MVQALYDERDFDRLPILADALEEAGCDNATSWHIAAQAGNTSGAVGWWTCCWKRRRPRAPSGQAAALRCSAWLGAAISLP